MAGLAGHHRIPVRLTIAGVVFRTIRHVRLGFNDSPGAPHARELHIQQLADAGQKRPWELPPRATNGRDALSLSPSLSPSLALSRPLS
jgi:hypothetical protein